MIPFDLNLWAVLACVAVNMALGMVWYSPFVLGKVWLNAMGWSEEELAARRKNAGKAYAGTTLAAAVTALGMALMVGWLGLDDPLAGTGLGALFSVSFVVTTSLSTALFEGRKPALFWIDNGYHFLSLAAMGAILAAWP